MTTEERRQLWQRFAKSAGAVLTHPNTPPAVRETLSAMLEKIAPDNAVNRIAQMPPLVPNYSGERNSHRLVDEFENHCSDLGITMGAILDDETTPARIRQAFGGLISALDSQATKIDPHARQAAIARMLLPELLIIVGTDNEPDAFADLEYFEEKAE